jgi:hypothetical protein
MLAQDGHYYTVAVRKDAETPRKKRRSSFASSTPVPPGGDSDFSDGDSGHPLDDDEEPDDLHNRTHSSVSHQTFLFHFPSSSSLKTCLYLVKTITTRWGGGGGASCGVAQIGYSMASS